MAGDTLPDSWKERLLISIIPDGGSAQDFAALTEDITAFDWGDKDIEGIPLVNGGRIAKWTPMTDESITMKVYPLTALPASTSAASSATGVVQLYHPQSTADETEPIVVDNSLVRKKFGIVILMAKTLPANATTLPEVDVPAYRIQIINAYMTSYKPSFDDKHFSAEITFKWTPFNKYAVSNKREESTGNVTSTQLAAAITTATSF